MAHLSVKHFSPLRKSFSPSRRHCRHFASRFLATWVLLGILNATFLRGTAAVVRYRRHVGYLRDLEAGRVERAHRRLAPRSRALDMHLEVLHAALLGKRARASGSHLSGEGRALARALEAVRAAGRPRERVALAVRNGDDGVVEGGVDVGDALRHVLLDLLAYPGAGFGHVWIPRYAVTARMILMAALRGPLRVRALVRVRW